MIRIIKGNVGINNYIIPVFLEGKRRDHKESGKRKGKRRYVNVVWRFGGQFYEEEIELPDHLREQAGQQIKRALLDQVRYTLLLFY